MKHFKLLRGYVGPVGYVYAPYIPTVIIERTMQTPRESYYQRPINRNYYQTIQLTGSGNTNIH